MNRNFGSIKDGVFEYADSFLKTEKGVMLNPSSAHYLAAGYKRVVDSPPEVDPKHFFVATNWKEEGDAIVRQYEVRENEKIPRRFSKLKLVLVLTNANLWDKVKSVIEGAGYYDVFVAAQEFAEDDPYFIKGVEAIKSALSLPDRAIETFLKKAVIT